jgi:hypothetical protein
VSGKKKKAALPVAKSGSVALRFQVEEMGRAAFERKSLPRSYAANE